MIMMLSLVLGMVPTMGVAETSSSEDIVAAEDLILRYTFDESNGATVEDVSGNGHDATLQGSASITAEGYDGQGAVDLDGQDAYVQLPEDILQDVNDFTVSTWVNVRTSSVFSRIFDFGKNESAYMFLTPDSGEGVRFGMSTGGWQEEQNIQHHTPLTEDEWQQVIVVKQGDVGRLLINGVEVQRNDNLTVTVDDIGEHPHTYLGKSQFEADPYFDGQMADFRVYDRALSPDEISALTGVEPEITEIEPILLAIHGDEVPTLPSEVEAVYNNGMRVALEVTWEDIDLDNIDSFKVYEGNVEGTDLTAKLRFKYKPVEIRDVPDVQVTTEQGVQPELPEQVDVLLTNGETQQIDVAWEDIDEQQLAESGSFTVEGTLQPLAYTNPLIEQRADPLIYKHTDGYYYFTASVPEYDRIVLRRAQTIEGLKDAEEKVIWTKHDEGEMGNHIWAPELHYINDKWYIYFAAGTAEDRWAIRQYALENTAENPLEGEWVEKGKVAYNFESFSLDATTFEHQGQLYMAWAQKDGDDSNVYIAEMENPWTISGEQVLITRPEYDWEIQGHRVNEGPYVIKRDGKLFMTFSASATDANYSIGLLAASADSDLLDPDSWDKLPYPIFTSDQDTSEYGPGHNSFTIAEDGETDLLVYHARSYEEIEGEPLYDPNRHTRVQPIYWNPDGSPNLGVPGHTLDTSLKVQAEVTVAEGDDFAFADLHHTLQHYTDGGEISRGVAQSLAAKLNNAERQESMGHESQALKQLEDAKRMLERGYPKNVSDEAYESLRDGIDALIERLSAETPEEGQDVHYTINIDGSDQSRQISPTLYGLFYEDINYAADGGLYAELVQNRSFEFDDAMWAWSTLTRGEGSGSTRIETEMPLNEHNPHYLQLSVDNPGKGVGIVNSGFDGIPIEKNENYLFSVYVRTPDHTQDKITVSLESTDGEVYGQAELEGITSDWKKLEATIRAQVTDANAQLTVTTSAAGTLDVDMVSLFPEETWQNRPNGMRQDLAQMLADLQPQFFRFPGGCIVEGGGLEHYYNWKDTIGDVAERPMNVNFWRNNQVPHYNQSYGLGYFEYFQFAKDIGAEPLPVVYAGITSCTSDPEMVPVEDLDPYIQDALDLIEYANGPATSEWGAKRAEAGHPEPFDLKYLAIGNEVCGPDYHERYVRFYDAIKQAYPDIELVVSAGWSPDDHCFHDTWEWLDGTPAEADMVDEHMYQSPEWFYRQATRYDDYDRNGPNVFIGEYAAHTSNIANNMESALAEAAFMTGFERNADVVQMAAYAPLLAKEHYNQWAPNMIWFNNTDVYGTPNYYVQQMFSTNTGDIVLPTTLTENEVEPDPISGAVLLGSWNTAVEYDHIQVKSDGETLFSDDFTDFSSEWEVYNGNWQVEDGVLQQLDITEDARVQVGEQEWHDYTISVRARKTSGTEGMLIGFGVQGTDDYYWWNLGGWNNTQTAIEKSVNGTKSIVGQATTHQINPDQWYDIEIEVSGQRIRCYLDGELIHDVVEEPIADMYTVTSYDQETGDIILKVVNASEENQRTQVKLEQVDDIHPVGTATVLQAESKQDENSFEQPELITPQTHPITGLSRAFEYDFPANAVTILKLKTRQD